jgi:uncharacterized membrane protein
MNGGYNAPMRTHLRNKFIAGMFAAIPLAVTAFVLWYVEKQMRMLSGVQTPFVGVALALVAIYLLGVVVSSLLGRAALRTLDRALEAIPGVRELYHAWKHITVTPDGSGIFSRVALVPDMLGGWTLAFTSGRPIPGNGELTCVFIPAAPNPTSGRLCLVPAANCRFVNVSPEEAFKMILSGGNYVPEGIGESACCRE